MSIIRQSNVIFNRWKDFRTAVNQMINDGTYQRLANIHANRVTDPDGLVRSPHRMHGAQYGPIGFRRFLPWHRAYLVAFERELRKFDKTLSLPYWDWDNDQGRLIGFHNFFGMSADRDLGLLPRVQPTDPRDRPWFSTEALTEALETFDGDYYVFTRELELGPHGGGHNWIGGNMANTQISPTDVVFWLHHAMIDRIWAKWQIVNPNERAHLNDSNGKLDPWDDEFTVVNIDDISNLGDDSYGYEDPVRPAPTTTP